MQSMPDLATLLEQAIVVVPDEGVLDVVPSSSLAAGVSASPAQPEDFTDLGNAYRLVRVYGDALRHVDGWGWLAWDGRRWKRDEKAAMVYAKQVALSYYEDAQDLALQAQAHLDAAQRAAAVGDDGGESIALRRSQALQAKSNAMSKWAKASQSRSRLEAMVKLAESEPAISAQAHQFDVCPWLLNCLNGTIDLRTGVLGPHDRDDLITALAPVDYDPAATCLIWDAFVKRIMAGNVALTTFLQRIIGYALTGSVSEQALFFLHGLGANGKSTFLKTILAVLGRDYAKQAAPDVLVENRNRHPTEVADLAGVRFVASIEVSDGKRLAEALVKQLTGGDPIKARHMRQDFFQFDPTFKILLAANHKPVIKGTDHAIWRRIKLIPFTVTIPEAEQDKALDSKLLKELPGILAWAVRGCLDWQRDGLGVPSEVVDATAAYRAESDVLTPFLDERCVRGEEFRTQAGPLFAAYRDWADANGIRSHDQLTTVSFGRELQTRGFDKSTDKSKRLTFYAGLDLLSDPPASSRE